MPKPQNMVRVDLTEDEVIILLRATTEARAANEARFGLSPEVDTVCLRREMHLLSVERTLMDAAGIRFAR